MTHPLKKPAREKFSVGARVRMTTLGRRTLCAQRRGPRTRLVTTGVVVGFGRSPYIVRVQRDGLKEHTAYDVAFWQCAPHDVHFVSVANRAEPPACNNALVTTSKTMNPDAVTCRSCMGTDVFRRAIEIIGELRNVRQAVP